MLRSRLLEDFYVETDLDHLDGVLEVRIRFPPSRFFWSYFVCLLLGFCVNFRARNSQASVLICRNASVTCTRRWI